MNIQDSKLFKIGKPMLSKWYNIDEKALIKTRLGKLHHAIFRIHEKDKEIKGYAREIEFERISTYVIEKFQNRMLQLL